MGGVFDPIHYGHLFAAEEARINYNLEKVIFVPCNQPIHKINKIISHAEHRYSMVLLAIKNNPFFKVSKIELLRKGFSYSIDTIKEMMKKYNNNVKIFFITGADAFLEFDTWFKSDELIKLCEFVATTRPGYDLSRMDRKFKNIVNIMKIPALAISSTNIRNRMKENKSVKYLLPDNVIEYIKKNNLYQLKKN